jgi:hypothetical protein
MTTSPIEMPGHSTPVLSLAEAPDAKPFDALYKPRLSDGYAPPLSTALRLAREGLTEQQTANIHDRTAMVRAATILEFHLRQVLAALDADRAAAVRPLAEGKGGAA